MAEEVKEKTQAKVKLGRTLDGVVVSDSADKTIVVKVVRAYKHPRLGKTIRSSKRYQAHDESSEAHVGDIVSIESCRPLSKNKKMRLVGVLKQASARV